MFGLGAVSIGDTLKGSVRDSLGVKVITNFVIWFSVRLGLRTLKSRFRFSGRTRVTIADRVKLELGINLI